MTSADERFEAFELIWRFESRSSEQTTVALNGELELRVPLLRDLFSRIAIENVSSILSAFEHRARLVCHRAPRQPPAD